MLSRRTRLLFLSLMLPLTIYAGDLNEDLLAAVRKSDVAAVKALLDQGANVNAKTPYGATPLSYACDRGNLEIVNLLLERGAEVNAKDTFYGETPLGWALSKGHTAIVKALIEKGAEGKDRALMVGVNSGNVEIVKFVLEKGGLKPDTLKLALNSATKNKRAEIEELLKKAGAIASPQPNFQVAPETLKTYAGTYKNSDGMEIKLTFQDGKLTGGPTGQNPVTLGAVDQATFKPAGLESITVIFKLEGGKVSSFTLKEGGNSTIFKKVEEK